jgi:hypothetical protein
MRRKEQRRELYTQSFQDFLYEKAERVAKERGEER